MPGDDELDFELIASAVPTPVKEVSEDEEDESDEADEANDSLFEVIFGSTHSKNELRL